MGHRISQVKSFFIRTASKAKGFVKKLFSKAAASKAGAVVKNVARKVSGSSPVTFLRRHMPPLRLSTVFTSVTAWFVVFNLGLVIFDSLRDKTFKADVKHVLRTGKRLPLVAARFIWDSFVETKIVLVQIFGMVLEVAAFMLLSIARLFGGRGGRLYYYVSEAHVLLEILLVKLPITFLESFLVEIIPAHWVTTKITVTESNVSVEDESKKSKGSTAVSPKNMPRKRAKYTQGTTLSDLTEDDIKDPAYAARKIFDDLNSKKTDVIEMDHLSQGGLLITLRRTGWNKQKVEQTCREFRKLWMANRIEWKWTINNPETVYVL